MHLLLLWMLNAVALLAVTYLLPFIQVSGFGAALLAALVLNGLLLWLASAPLPGFHVEGFGPAVFGAILYGVIA